MEAATVGSGLRDWTKQVRNPYTASSCMRWRSGRLHAKTSRMRHRVLSN